MSRTRAGWLAVAVLAGLAACAPGTPGGGSTPAAAPSTGTCLAASGAQASRAPATAGGGTARAGGSGLPNLTLPCFDGSGNVQLGQWTGPAVVNLWASWCPPCLSELPAFQRYAERAAGRVAVVGVITEDTRDGAQSIVDRLGLTFPMLYDAESSLRVALRGKPLPVTVLVDRDGAVAYVYNGVALDDARLAQLVEQHLGEAVPG